MLNTEEYAIISFIILLLICITHPITEVDATKIRVGLFNWNSIKYRGASFCQVIKRVPFFSEIFLVTVINHWCKGPAASLIIKAKDPKTPPGKTLSTRPISFVDNIVNNKRIEVMDWMMKYFILISLYLAGGVLPLQDITQQKDIVFISNVIQILTHELQSRQTMGVVASSKFIARYLLISYRCLIAN